MSERLIKYILVLAILGVLYVMLQKSYERQYQTGLREGKAMALKTNPPSEELEMACAGLWIGEQNKKYWKKTNAN